MYMNSLHQAGKTQTEKSRECFFVLPPHPPQPQQKKSSQHIPCCFFHGASASFGGKSSALRLIRFWHPQLGTSERRQWALREIEAPGNPEWMQGNEMDGCLEDIPGMVVICTC